MAEILLGQSYFLRFDPKLWAAMQPYAPLGTLYAASVLRRRGYGVALFDAMLAVSEAEWDDALRRQSPRFAILYEDNFNYLSKMCLSRMRQAAHVMIGMAKSRGCTVILCGADATDHAEDYLTRGADYVLVGEGEETLLELLAALRDSHPVGLESIRGLVYMQDGIPRRTPRRQDISDLDGLPFPAWDLVDVERYRSIWMKRHGWFSMNMVTTRGCPFHCNWCAKPIWGQRYHSRSPQNVAAEMSWMKNAYRPDHIWFADDILGLKPGWITSFAEQVAAQDCRIPFKCLSRADLLTRPGEVEALARAGAHSVWLGAESGSQKILDAMDKGIRIEQIREARRRLASAGIQAGFFLQFGYPGETLDDIRMTLQLVREADPDDIGMSVSYPLPGTRFHEAVRQQLGSRKNWRDSDDLAMLYHGPFSTRFYRRLHTVLHREFRLRKAWRSLRQRPNLRQAGRLVYNLLTLPFARLQLRLLAVPNREMPLLPHLPRAAASAPSEQAD